MKDTSTDATILRHNSLLNPWKLGISIKKRKEKKKSMLNLWIVCLKADCLVEIKLSYLKLMNELI